MDLKQKQKLIGASLFVLLTMTSSCYVVLTENNFSVEYVKLAVNTFVPMLAGLGWVIYFSVKNDVKVIGDLDLKLKIAVIGTLIIIVLFVLLYLILGTNPKLLFNN